MSVSAAMLPMPDVGTTYHPPVADDPKHGKGYQSRNYAQNPLAGSPKCHRLSIPLIPRSEWQARIQAKTDAKTWIVDICDQAGLPVKNQAQTNLCWSNAATHCVEIMRVMQGDPALVLSAANVACHVNGFVNQGGSGIDAVNWIVKNGVCTDAIWPNTAIARQYDTPAAATNASLHTITGWFDLDPSSDDEIVTCVLSDIPVTVGVPLWSHEITITFLKWTGSTFQYGIDNSWSPSWGVNGRGTLSGGYARFDEAGAPYNVMPSNS